MATERYPNRNVNYPMKQSAVDAARARLDPGPASHSPVSVPTNGKGSLRKMGHGEWIDDRVITIDGPPSKSADTPPLTPAERGSKPTTYDPTKVYAVTLFKPAVHAGRILSPAKEYLVAGHACPDMDASIVDAIEVGDIPQEPVAPSSKRQEG